MRAWTELVGAALLGTGRAAVPGHLEGSSRLQEALSRIDGTSPERWLLAAAALLTTWQRAGAAPQPAPSALPAPASADGLSCPPVAARHLGRILQGDMAEVLPEWLRALAASGCVLPHRWLPEILDVAREKPGLRLLILPLLGERGRWLAAQDPAWQDLARCIEPGAMPEVWETGTREARLALLARLRQVDPARARELVAATWAKEAARDRGDFLATFADGLSLADEPFLEAALGDRRKEVRTVAADLLARLPGSQWVRRMQERLRPLFRLERGLLGRDKLHVALPEAWDVTMARDGLVEQAPHGLGQHAWWLLQMIAMVPPAVWSESWGRTPEEIIRLVMKDEQHVAMLEGFSAAAARQRDPAWAQAILLCWGVDTWKPALGERESGFWGNLEDLLAAAPQGWLELWLAKRLQSSHGALRDNHPLLELFKRYQRPWGEGLMRAFLDAMHDLARKPYYETYNWRAALPKFACYAAPTLADEAERGWPSDTSWTETIDRFLAILRFRRDMLQALR